MRKALYLLLFFIFTFGTSFASDSLRFLTLRDTVFLQVNKSKSKSMIHTVEPMQTLFSIAKFYGLSTTELKIDNPQIKSNIISIGQKLTITIPNKAIIRYKKNDFDEYSHVPVYYTVKPGDNLFGIAKRIFKMPVDSVKWRNQLSSDVISVGQKLHVGWMHADGIPAEYRPSRLTTESQRDQILKRRFAAASKGKKQHYQQGVAYWQKDRKQKSDLYALHRKAPLNSTIVVSNPMMGKKVFVKVIGRIPEAVYTDDVIIVISSAAAKKLGAKDPRFFVKLKYHK